jgi:hypothetical protein
MSDKIKLLPFHKRLTDLFPAMTEQEFDDLVGDINIHGQRNPVDIWNGEIIDGKHRALACQRLEIEPRYQERRFKDEAGARAYVISLNMARRHLTPEQKRKLIAELLKTDPTKSDNSIAKQAKTTNKTVAAQRKKLEGRKEIPNVSKRTDAKGRKQPAKKGSKGPAEVELKPKAEPKVEPKAELKAEPTYCCSFCAKSQHEVGRLIAADRSGSGVFICNECVVLCVDLLLEEQGVNIDERQKLVERLHGKVMIDADTAEEEARMEPATASDAATSVADSEAQPADTYADGYLVPRARTAARSATIDA